MVTAHLLTTPTSNWRRSHRLVYNSEMKFYREVCIIASVCVWWAICFKIGEWYLFVQIAFSFIRVAHSFIQVTLSFIRVAHSFIQVKLSFIWVAHSFIQALLQSVIQVTLSFISLGLHQRRLVTILNRGAQSMNNSVGLESHFNPIQPSFNLMQRWRLTRSNTPQRSAKRP